MFLECRIAGINTVGLGHNDIKVLYFTVYSKYPIV